jgi:hypothetical protein
MALGRRFKAREDAKGAQLGLDAIRRRTLQTHNLRPACLSLALQQLAPQSPHGVGRFQKAGRQPPKRSAIKSPN